MIRENTPDFLLTQDNMDDRALLKHMDFHKRIFGRLFEGRGYISKDLFEQLFIDRVHIADTFEEGDEECLNAST